LHPEPEISVSQKGTCLGRSPERGEGVVHGGLSEILFEDYFDKELPPVRRFRACLRESPTTDATDAEQRHADADVPVARRPVRQMVERHGTKFMSHTDRLASNA